MASSRTRLQGVDAKIVRAKIHIETLEQQIVAYLTPGVAKFPSKLDRQKRTCRVTFHLLVEPPLPLSIIAGDVVHNARSALDHLWGALTRSSDSRFPCYRETTKWDDAKADFLCRVPSAAHALVESLQPCSGTNDGHLLGLLNMLSNRDKHKVIYLTATKAIDSQIELRSKSTHQTALFDIEVPFYPNTHIDFVDLTDEFMEGGVDVNIKGFMVVAFKDAPIAGISVRDLLKDTIAAIEHRIIPTLRTFIQH